MGGAAIGLLASMSDLLGALVSGTAILLVIMIMFQMYQQIAQGAADLPRPGRRTLPAVGVPAEPRGRCAAGAASHLAPAVSHLSQVNWNPIKVL